MADKTYKSSLFKRIIDLGLVREAEVNDLVRIWRVGTGDEKAITLQNFVNTVDTDLGSGGLTLTEIVDIIAGELDVLAFIDLTDTPATYVGQGGKSVLVKVDETGLEFVSAFAGGLGAEPIQEKFTYVSPDPQTFVVAGSPNGRPDLYMNGQFIDFTFWTWDVGTKTATITGITLVDGAKIVLAYYANISGTYAWDGITLNGNTIGGVKRLIEIGDILIIPLYWQYIVTSLDVDGIIINEGEIIIG